MGIQPSSVLALMPWLLTAYSQATAATSSNVVELPLTTSSRSGKPDIIITLNGLFSSTARDYDDDDDDDVTTTSGNHCNSNRMRRRTRKSCCCIQSSSTHADNADRDNLSILLYHDVNRVPRGGEGGDTIIGLDDNNISTIEDESEIKFVDGMQGGMHQTGRRRRSSRNPIRRIGKKLTPLFFRARNFVGRSAAKKLQQHHHQHQQQQHQLSYGNNDVNNNTSNDEKVTPPLFLRARNLVGRSAAKKIQQHRSDRGSNDDDEVMMVVDPAFEELDRILENATATTTTTTITITTTTETNEIQEEDGLRDDPPEDATSDEDVDDLMEKTTWPPLQQAASLLKWRKQNSLRDWINEMEFKFCSAETAKALGTIRNIIDTFSDYGVVDLFGMYR